MPMPVSAGWGIVTSKSENARTMLVVVVYRKPCFSPNSEAKDALILRSVVYQLIGEGHVVSSIREEDLEKMNPLSLSNVQLPDIILSMARGGEALAVLQGFERLGVTVVNSPEAVRCAKRSNILRLMRQHSLPCAPSTGNIGYWVKRADSVAESEEDIVFAQNDEQRDKAIRQMRLRGIKDIVTEAHLDGDLVKFYGVRGTDFFACCYPQENGGEKFQNERHNSPLGHYPLQKAQLQRDCRRLAKLVGLTVYGGDCIVAPDGSYTIIDFNDFPSFSAVRGEAAKAIKQALLMMAAE